MYAPPSSNNTNEPLTANDTVDSEVFQVVTLNSDTFVIPRRGGESLLSGKVNCSVPFSKHRQIPRIWADLFISSIASPDGRACLAVGCAEGLWIGDRNNSHCEGFALPPCTTCLLLSRLRHSLAPCIAYQDGNAMCDARRVWNFPRPRK